MRFLGSLDRRDRGLLLACGAMVTVLLVLLVLFSPAENDNDPTPSSYAATTHGAKAAYLLLQQSGYHIERWERPLADLADEVNEHTTLIIAQPYFSNAKEAKGPIKRVLDHGGRVLVTGLAGGYLVPDGEAAPIPSELEAQCKATPNGFSNLANSGDVRLAPEARWNELNPKQQTAYTCGDKAVIVTYAVGKGTVVWWASSLPLENSGIQRGDNLALLLNSIGPAGQTRVVWDESLHGDLPSLWSFVEGTPLHLVWWQLGLVALLLLLSFGRRSGPLRPDPTVTRTAPIEFVQSLGELYRKAGATNTAVTVAYQRFRSMLEHSYSVPSASFASARQLSASLAKQFGSETRSLERDLIACESAAGAERMPVNRALDLVRALRDQEEFLRSKLHSVTKEDRLGRNAS
jgi:hypothetical protein